MKIVGYLHVLYAWGSYVGVLLGGDGNCPQKLWYVNTKKLSSKKAWQPKLVVFYTKLFRTKMNPSHCRDWYCVPKTPIRKKALIQWHICKHTEYVFHKHQIIQIQNNLHTHDIPLDALSFYVYDTGCVLANSIARRPFTGPDRGQSMIFHEFMQS